MTGEIPNCKNGWLQVVVDTLIGDARVISNLQVK